MIVRGWMALGFASLSLVVGDVVQRGLVAPWVRLRPASRIPVLGTWIKIMAWLVTRPVSLLGGFTMPRPPRIVPTRPGVLVVMNHQSLFDIPLVVQTVVDGYPRIVTRARYARRYIPVISHMVDLYQYPVVDARANRALLAKSLDDLEDAALASDVPLAVFPEGTRTRDGKIGRFKTAGLTKILSVRPWTVYVYVVDGFWQVAKYKDFLRRGMDVDGRVEHAGTLEWTDPGADSEPFLQSIRQLMVERLNQMRAGGP